MTHAQPSKIRPWLVWGSAALFTMYQFMLQGSPSVMIPNLISAFGIDTAQVGFLTTYFFYSYITMQIPSGILIDIFGPKVILVIGSAAAATACLAFANCHSTWSAKSSRLLMGFVCAPGIVAALTLASRWFNRKRFALVVGFTETLAMSGAAFGMVLLAYTVHHFGWREAIFICAMVGYLVSILILIFVRNFPPDQPRQQVSVPKISFNQEAINLWMVIKEPQVWIGGLYSGLSFSIIPAYFALWSVPFLMDRFQIPTTHAAYLASVGFIGAAIGGPTLGWFSSHIHRRKIPMIVCSFISFCIVVLIVYFRPSHGLMYVLNFLLGFFLSSYILPFAIVSEILPPHVKGKAMGFTNCLTLVVGAPVLQPLIGSFLRDTTDPHKIAVHRFTEAFTSLPIVLIIAFILSFFIRETFLEHDETHPS